MAGVVKDEGSAPPPTGPAPQHANVGGQVPDPRPQTEGTRGSQPEQQRAVSSLDIQLVQSLVERCLQLYMNKREVLSVLEQQAKIEPGFTGLVWQQLEEQNPDFFKVYYVRLRLKDQIVAFNQLIERHYHMLRANPPAPQDPGQAQQSQQGLGGHSGYSGVQQPGSQPQHQGHPQLQAQGHEQHAHHPQHPHHPPPGDPGHFYDERHGAAAMLLSRDQGVQRQHDARDGAGGLSTSAFAAVSDPHSHGDLGSAPGAVQPLRSASHGEGVLAKESTFSDFHASSGLSGLHSEHDGLVVGGMNTFLRNFSLSDLTMDLQQGNDAEQTLHLLSTFQDGGETYGMVGPSGTNANVADIKRNFSLSDVNMNLDM